MLMGSKERSCTEYPMACMVAGPHSSKFLPMGIHERMLIQEAPPTQ